MGVDARTVIVVGILTTRLKKVYSYALCVVVSKDTYNKGEKYD